MDKRPPPKCEIDVMIRNATVRERIIVALLAFSGLCPESLGNYNGSSALCIKNIEGVKIGNDGIEFSVFPAILKIRQLSILSPGRGTHTSPSCRTGMQLHKGLHRSEDRE
jgi:hypothetical protein